MGYEIKQAQDLLVHSPKKEWVSTKQIVLDMKNAEMKNRSGAQSVGVAPFEVLLVLALVSCSTEAVSI